MEDGNRIASKQVVVLFGIRRIGFPTLLRSAANVLFWALLAPASSYLAHQQAYSYPPQPRRPHLATPPSFSITRLDGALDSNTSACPHHRVQIWSPIHTKRTILSLEELARNSTSQSLSTMSWLDMQTRQAGVLPQEALRDGLSVDFLQPLGNRAGVHGVNAQLNLPYCSRVRAT
jgi:hypothetical protein